MRWLGKFLHNLDIILFKQSLKDEVFLIKHIKNKYIMTIMQLVLKDE